MPGLRSLIITFPLSLMKSMWTIGETRGNGGGGLGEDGGGRWGPKGMCQDKDTTFGTGKAKERLGESWEERCPGTIGCG